MKISPFLCLLLPLFQTQTSLFRFGVDVEMVGLYATVQDRSGKLVTGLNESDFVIYDNGFPQQISQFSREYAPLSVSILLDNSSSMAGLKLENARRSLEHFIGRLNRGDEAMLMTFRSRPRLVSGFTQDLGAIKRSLKRLDGSGSTALYDAILATLDYSARSANRRRALLLISDGMNTYGRAELHETIDQLKACGVELFAIGIESGLPEDFQDRVVTRSVLDQLTQSAGGEAFMVTGAGQLGKVCAAISERMHKQYAFGYYPPKSADGRWHNIRLETRVPGLRVVPSKAGYYPLVQRTASRP
jgi:VWFA-related protein